jgi:uncharacterized protein YgfB (UPF0149 family)
VTHEPAITTFDYDALRDSLAAAGAVVTLAELHGGLAGALCAGGVPAATVWLADCLEDQELEPLGDLNDSLTEVIAATWRVLDGRQLEFEPLLPSDDTALEEQVQALGLWCHGFVAGLGSSAPELAARGVADDAVAEVIRDFTEISRAGLSDEEAAGDDQPDFALAELREYLRAGVQIVFEDLAERRAAARDLH